jgi:hypothetical protein
MEFMKKINEISKAVGKTASDTYNTVADKSGKAIEDAKLKIAISEKEEEINEIYIKMGKTVYEEFKAGEDVGKVFTKESKLIDKKSLEIDEMNKKILYNKSLRECSECKEIIGVECAFCPTCGSKQKTIKFKTEKKEEKKEEVENKVCPQCGLICEANAKFCTKCGASLK